MSDPISKDDSSVNRQREQTSSSAAPGASSGKPASHQPSSSRPPESRGGEVERWRQLARGRKLGILQAIAIAVATFLLGYFVHSMRSPAAQAPPPEADSSQAEQAAQKWTCSMHPQVQKAGPGKCPLCGMDLIPLTAGAGGATIDLRRLSISPAARGLMNIQTSPVERRFATAEVRLVGKVEYDETRLKYITAWVPGRLDRLYVDYTGVEVKKGDHMVSLYSEKLYSAQEELIQAIRAFENRRSTSRFASPVDLVESAREKLRLWGITAEQIKQIEERGKSSSHMTIFAPMGGIVIHKNAQEGMRVETGTRIYTIADLSQLWVKLDAYESDLPWLRYGQKVTFTTEAYPGETFVGKIAFIDRMLDPKTRTVKVRVNVPNPRMKLKPEMFVHGIVRTEVAAGGRVMAPELQGKWISPMHPEIVKDDPGFCDVCGMPLVRAESLGYVSAIADESAKPLVIPVSAALRTGTRAVVYVEVPDTEQPTYEGREIVLGPRAGEYYLVKSGLEEGEFVVTNGNFKLDSALQITAKPSMMTPEGGGGGGGHQHGDSAHENGASQGKTSTQLPAAVRRQLHAVQPAYQEVARAVQAGDPEQIRMAFDSLGDAVNAVDGVLLSGHSKMLWKELGMLLGNDAVEGSAIKKLSDGQRVFDSLSNNMRRLRDQFALGHGDSHSPALSSLTVPDQFQHQLGRLWNGYLGLQVALAGDDLPQAQQALEPLEQAFAKVNMKLLEGEAHDAWMREGLNLQKILEELGKDEDLKDLRADFALLSEEMTVLIRSFGIGTAGPVYRLHCPMAFEGHGASWLQKDDQIRNPFFGSAMLKCADDIELIVKDAQDQGGHNHG